MPSKEIEAIKSALRENKQVVAMVAPSFIVDFSYPEIIHTLKSLGFDKVVEVTVGARETNRQLKALIEAHPQSRFITSPCPTITRYIGKKYPELMSYLATIDSPMSATAKFVREKYKGCVPVFIGPCFVKKLEASENYPELEIIVITYQELQGWIDELLSLIHI